MVLNFVGKSGKGGHGHGHGHGHGGDKKDISKETRPMLTPEKESPGDVELGALKK
jgi:hypothetical protein